MNIRKEGNLMLNETGFCEAKDIFVYRIKWNEINSEDGKIMMRDKIDLLMDFIERFN